MEEPRNVLSQEVREYARHCQTLLRDIDYVLNDHTVTSVGGVSIHYAVDFSEIYNYVLPEETHETAPFPDGWVTGDPLQQYYVLSRFFSWKNIVLLEPYALELRSFLDALVDHAIPYSLEEIDAAIEQLEEIWGSPRGKAMLRIAKESVHRELSPPELSEATRFYEDYGLLLGSAMRGMRFEPLHRFHQMLKQKPFIPIEQLTGGTPHLDKQRINERMQLLVKRRGRHHAVPSYNDAMAIEQVRAANLMLSGQRKLLRLVTRSPHMDAVVVEESHRREGEQVPPFVRHPRIFSAAYLPAGGLTPEFIKLLQGRRDSIAVFIDTVTNAPLDRLGWVIADPAEAEEQQKTIIRIRTMMDQIRKDWSSGESLAGTFSDEGELEFKNTDSEAAARKMLLFLRQSQDLATNVRARIRQVFRYARRGLGVLGVNLQHAHPEPIGSILYPLTFGSKSLTADVAALASRWTISGEAAHRLFDAASDTASDYDLFLGLAVCLGATGRWTAAERYAELAANQADTEGISPHEAYFFSALCARKALREADPPETVQRAIARAISNIGRAARRQRRLGGDDARYLNEAAVVKMWWLQFMKPAEDVVRRERKRIAARLRRVLLLKPAEKLVLQAHNNLTYLYLMPPRDLETARVELDALIGKLDALYPSRADWPPSILDTVVYANFRLRHDTEGATLGEMVKELRALATHVGFSAREREWVQSHIAEIRDVLRAAEAKTTLA